MRTSLIIPAIDEGESLGQVLAKIEGQLVDEIILVDGGFSNNTVAVAEAAGAKVIVESRRGYGRACVSGVDSAIAVTPPESREYFQKIKPENALPIPVECKDIGICLKKYWKSC